MKVDQSVAGSGTSEDDLDITDLGKVDHIITHLQPDLVINTAAFTQVDNAEMEEALAFRVNKTGCTHRARVCAKNQIPRVHISTDCVFDGQQETPYLETDPITPLGGYGRCKAETEIEIRSICERLRSGSDSDGGAYPYCGSGIISWHTFAAKIMELIGLHAGVRTARVEPVTTADYPTPAVRPVYSALDCGRIHKHFGIRPQPWQKSLELTIDSWLPAPDGPKYISGQGPPG